MKKYYVCDFETYTFESEYFKKYNDTNLIYGYIEELYTTFNNRFLSFAAFFDFLYLNETNKVIYFHNLKFDGDFIVKYLINQKNYLLVNSLNELKNNCVYLFADEKSYYKIIVKHYCKEIKKYYNLTFLCSYKLLGLGVGELGNKLEINYHLNNQNEITENHWQYCINDVLIVKNSLLKLCNLFNKTDKFNALTKLTRGSLSIQLLKNHLQYVGKDPQEYFFLDAPTYNYCKRFYYGGVVGFNYQVQNKTINCENGGVVDAINHYGSTMLKYKLPYGQLLDEKPSLDHTTLLTILIKKAKLKSGFHHCFLRNIVDRKTRFLKVLKNPFVYFFYDYEFEMLKNFYEFDYKIIETKYMLTAYIFGNYHQFLNKIRDNFKSKNDNFAKIIKGLANDVYGKMGQNKDLEMCFYSEKILKVGEIVNHNNNDYYVLHTCTKQSKIGNYNRYILRNAKIKETGYNIACGAAIAAICRTLLMKMVYLNYNEVIYWDTDSMFLKNIANLHPKNLIGNDLGQWKIEQSNIKSFKIAGAKNYAYEFIENGESKFKIAMAGFNKKIINQIGPQVVAQDFVKNGCLTTIKTKNGIILCPIDKQIKKINRSF